MNTANQCFNYHNLHLEWTGDSLYINKAITNCLQLFQAVVGTSLIIHDEYSYYALSKSAALVDILLFNCASLNHTATQMTPPVYLNIVSLNSQATHTI